MSQLFKCQHDPTSSVSDVTCLRGGGGNKKPQPKTTTMHWQQREHSQHEHSNDVNTQIHYLFGFRELHSGICPRPQQEQVCLDSGKKSSLFRWGLQLSVWITAANTDFHIIRHASTVSCGSPCQRRETASCWAHCRILTACFTACRDLAQLMESTCTRRC